MAEWEQTTVGELIDRWGGSIKTGPFGTALKSSEYTPTGVPLISVGEIGYGRFRVDNNTPRVDSTVTRRLPEYLLRAGDIVFGRKGAVDRSVMVSANEEGWFLGSDGIRLRLLGGCNSRFAFYYMSSKAARNWLIQHSTGSTMASLNQGIIGRLPLRLPPLHIQEAISEILSTLDDKIDLNRQLNETLEAMAQAIFKDWFVDFGPVRRKMEGATDPVAVMGGLVPDPGRAAKLAALFPNSLGDGELPNGWDEEPVLEQANYVNGAAYKKMHFVPPGDGLPVIKIAELKAGVTTTTGFTNTDLGSRYRIDDGELLFSWSGNPDTSIDTFIWTGGPAWLNQHIFAVRPNGSRTLGFLFAMLKYLNPTFAEIARDKQTTGLGHVTKEDLKRLLVVVPPTSIEAAFDNLMTPIFQKMQAGLLENRTLAETRDYLLPRLMSGEVRVDQVKPAAAA